MDQASLFKKIESSSLPAGLLEKAKELISSSSPTNIESVSNYINLITSLPFDKQTLDNLDLKVAKEILDKNHYGLENVKNIILEYLASLVLQKQNKIDSKDSRTPILCLVGLVGTGKTTMAESIAKALGRKFERIPFGGMGDAKTLRGQSRTFADAEPGLVIKKIIDAASSNPVILLDELDRVTDEFRADVMGVLVEL